MDVIALIGRILFVIMFLNSGVKHLRQREGLVAYARSAGGPAPELMVPLTGVMLLAGGALVALGLWPDLGALLLVAFLLPTAYYMHGFWRVEDPQMRTMQETHFWKNVSLAGASLLLFALFVECGDQLGLMAGGPLF
ncbi:MAG TPA: DoxX family protein [Thermoleophilaceae bacterium]|nr:DoxX family protein [Thermoleophilaceae bacterium]